ncbi:MAG: TetR/AcrR family transcriptional regulator C-terminal domain-containing protein [Actinomycetota bacterium]|nr:TetR/AcrR family transcriptional regulator C-terminal domain-containing protein [Actinomycetota bacterium]
MAAVKRHVRGRIDRDHVVERAVAIADRGGIEALTMRRLAEACGLSPMGLYRHIRDRSDLLDLIVQRVLLDIPAPPSRGSWQTRTRRLFEGMRTVSLAHPGVVALGVARATPVPAMARFTDHALGIMSQAGFAGDQAMMAYDAMLMFTIGSVLWQIPRSGAEREGLLRSATPSEMPHLFEHATVLGRRDPDAYFSYGFVALLTGLDEQRRSPTR